MDADALATALACLRITRRDTADFLKRLLTEPHPRRPLTANEIGGLIPTRHGKGRDRETARKLVARPLVEMGVLERVTRERDGSVAPGHPRPRSPYCAYRLTQAFWGAARAGFAGAAFDLFLDKTPEARMQARAQAVAERCAEYASESLHERLLDACLDHFRSIHLGEAFQCVYRDPVEGPRVTMELCVSLSAAGLSLDPMRDPYPDLVFWSERTGALCFVEGVTSEGAIDARRQAALKAWVRRCQGRGGALPKITFVTAFASWKAAAPFLGSMGRGTAVWVQEDPYKLIKVCERMKNFFE